MHSASALFFFSTRPAPLTSTPLSLRAALPIFRVEADPARMRPADVAYLVGDQIGDRSEEHTSELQSPYDLVCRLLLEKKKAHIYKEILLTAVSVSHDFGSFAIGVAYVSGFLYT